MSLTDTVTMFTFYATAQAVMAAEITAELIYLDVSSSYIVRKDNLIIPIMLQVGLL